MNIGISLILFFVIILIVSGAIVKKKVCESEFLNDDVCLTPGCVHTASQVLNRMDETVNPCDDFYNFACGKASLNTSTDEDELQKQLRSIISEEIDPNDFAPFNIAKKLYNACMNTTQIEEQGLKPMLAILEQLGDWPLLEGDEWDPKSEWSWTRTVKKLRGLGYTFDYIFDFFVDTNSKNSSARIIYVNFAF